MSDTDNMSLEGKLLIAMPMMGDDRFDRSVILVCNHDRDGAMGLVLNNVMSDVVFTDLVGQLKIDSDIVVDFSTLDLPVMCGGPMDAARGFLLHSDDFLHRDTMAVGKQYGITGTVDALKDIAQGNGPENLLFILGYAGWSAGQLESEIQQNAWLVVDSNPDLIFSDRVDEKWGRAVRCLGFDPGMLSTAAGRA